MVLCSRLTLVPSPDPRNSLPQSHFASAVWLAHLDLHPTAPRHTLLQALSSIPHEDSSGSLSLKHKASTQCFSQCYFCLPVLVCWWDHNILISHQYTCLNSLHNILISHPSYPTHKHVYIHFVVSNHVCWKS